MGMGKNEAKGEILIEVPGSPENQGSPVRAVLCLKDKVNMREIEEREDCFLLDFEPDDSAVDLSKLDHPSDKSDAHDVSVVAVVGQVACRDYPHSRHLCLKYPFGKTPHETHCELCYCFVCDTAAPCDRWSTGVLSGHCHAFDDRDWKYMRRLMRNRNATYTSSSSSE
ncbi:hypothetical protein RHSIM_Rhsim03G0216200 [Rhododendron simsii]|uniref:Uncharacterized protein n=1 Tax=Rhododendron simsii TaxID=118357 RepID=A0A834H7A4_RHOSS|nr:hypothetical protein RHSIM_Rhsim03G0216200 [Rhododendron simsii]